MAFSGKIQWLNSLLLKGGNYVTHMITMDSWTGAILVFDDASSQPLKRLHQTLPKIENVGGIFPSDVPPHITLMEHANMLDERYIHALRDFCARISPFDVDFCSVAYFPSTKVLFLNPKESDDLRGFRSGLLSSLEQAGLDYVRPPLTPWIPHTTILLDLESERVGKAIDAIQGEIDMQIGRPFVAHATAVQIFSYPPYKAEQTIPLGQAKRNE